MDSRPASTGTRLGRAAASLLQGVRPQPGRPAAVPAAASVQRALGRSGKHLLASLSRAFGHIGLQIAAVFYAVFALSFGAAGVHGWLHDHRLPGHRPLGLTQASAATQLELALALVFLYFAVSSLLRAGRRA
ncbi:MAG TPA: hypothetical protein VMV31_14545 [Terriglobales bacterium]|nr:hypothetical protein [Terriglobales bacterium]